MDEERLFRAEVQNWLEAHCPAAMREPVRNDADICWGGRNPAFQSEAQREWLERMAAQGWTVPTWPVAYGGAGLTSAQASILQEEMARINARPPLTSFGVWMLGPALMKYGSEEQKLEHLPRIARGEIRWCQGYSEPGAGSDLAGLMTKAEDKGDHWLVNGSKIWTSYAHKADWIFCLVRTESDAPKHKGISFLLFDMASAGVSAQPIELISGASIFCQTFFDNVVVPKGNLIGQRGNGWEIAKYLLQHERESIGGNFGLAEGESVSALACRLAGKQDGMLADRAIRIDIARHEMDTSAFAAAVDRVAEEMEAGTANPAISSMIKYYGTELNKQRHELTMAVAGSDGLIWSGDGAMDAHVPQEWLRSRANSIEGGTSEIQLNIIAKRILGLPQA